MKYKIRATALVEFEDTIEVNSKEDLENIEQKFWYSVHDSMKPEGGLKMGDLCLDNVEYNPEE